MSVGLSGEELLAWNDATFAKWMELVERHPEVMAVGCDVYGVVNVGELLHHVAMVELRYAQRLMGQPETTYEEVPVTVDGLRAAHGGMVERVRALLGDVTYGWESTIRFQTRSMGVLLASRKTVLVHTLMHSVRHYAQAAMLVRQAGIAPGFPMDYLFMGVLGWE